MNIVKETASHLEEIPARLRMSNASLFLSIILLSALTLFVAFNWGDIEHFGLLLEQAEPAWILLAFAFQLLTYLLLGFLWQRVMRKEKRSLPLRLLVPQAIKKLALDQLIPTGGVGGDMLIVRSLRRLGLPGILAVEVVVIDTVSRYLAYIFLSLVVFLILWFYRGVPALVQWLLIAFALVVCILAALLWTILRRKSWQPPHWLPKREQAAQTVNLLLKLSPEKLLSPSLLFQAMALQTAIFLLDAGTLWAVLQALGITIQFAAALTTVIVASIAGIVTFMPGGIGSFEATATAMLLFLGLPFEAALTGTLLLRGFTLWLPLLPGTILLRREVIRTPKRED